MIPKRVQDRAYHMSDEWDEQFVKDIRSAYAMRTGLDLTSEPALLVRLLRALQDTDVHFGRTCSDPSRYVADATNMLIAAAGAVARSRPARFGA